MLKKIENIYGFRSYDPELAPHLRNGYERYKSSIVGLAQEMTLLGETILGWALAFPDSWQGGRISAFYYVDPHHRRRGVGTELTKAISEVYPDTVSHPWDPTSLAFFEAVTGITQEVE